MKLINIIFAVLIVFSACKKKDAPEPVSSIDGTYKGLYQYSDGAHPDVIDSNATAVISNNTLTVKGIMVAITSQSANSYKITTQPGTGRNVDYGGITVSGKTIIFDFELANTSSTSSTNPFIFGKMTKQ